MGGILDPVVLRTGMGGATAQRMLRGPRMVDPAA